MAFKLQELKISPGGLNLLTPSDSQPELESLDLTDWWPGAAGKLEQAPEPAGVKAGGVPLSAGVPLDTVMKTGNRTYYAGTGNLYMDGTTIDTGYAVNYPVGMIAFQGYVWITSQGRQTKHDGLAVSNWTPDKPAAAPTLLDLGQFTGKKVWPLEDSYCYTWVIPKLGETNPSPPAQLTVGSDGDVEGHAIQITMPGGAPAEATGWNLYRRVPGYGGGGTLNLDANSIFYLLNTDGPIPLTQANFKDTSDPIDAQDDTSLLEFGQILEGDHGAAPAAAIMADQTFNGRIVVANSTAHPNRIWFTSPLQPAFFRGSGDDFDGDWVDVGTDSNDEIRAIIVRPNNMLVIYRARSIWVHLGDLGEANSILQPACLDIGIAGPRAVVSTAAGDYFVGTGAEGLYRFNNDWPTKLSQKIEPPLRGLGTENFGSQNLTVRNLCAVGHHRGRLYFSYTPTAIPAGSQPSSFILHIESDRWFACSHLYRAFEDTGDVFLGAGADGVVYAIENAFGDSSTGGTHLAWQSQYQDCGFPDHEKTWSDLVISGETRSQNLRLTIRTNKNATASDSLDMGDVNVSGQGKQIIALLYPPGDSRAGLPIRAFNLSVRLTGTGWSTPITLDSPMLLHYYLEARRAKLFDSGNTNHGLEGVGAIDQVELDIDSSAGAAGLVVWSDLPVLDAQGNVMRDRTSTGLPPTPVPVPQTSGRQVLRIQFPLPIYGRLFRHQVGSSTNFQLYGYRVRILPIGVHLDGSNPVNEFWFTEPLTAGI